MKSYSTHVLLPLAAHRCESEQTTIPHIRRKHYACILVGATIIFTLVLASSLRLHTYTTGRKLYSKNDIDSEHQYSPPNNATSSSQELILTRQRRNYQSTHTTRRLPQVLIIGVRKGGTRALLDMLYLHPRIKKAAGEVHFFDRDENYNRGLEWYREKMPYTLPDQITIEKSPSYFVTPEAAERIYAMNSSIRLLLILRDPVTRAISDYTQLRENAHSEPSTFGKNHTTRKTFEELAIRTDGTVNRNYKPIMVSEYHRYLLQWLDVFQADQILVVNGDSLIEEPLPELNKIESFLRLDSVIRENHFSYNQTKGFYCLVTKAGEKCLSKSKGRKHPRVHPLVITKLREYFAQHNRKLYSIIGKDLGWPEK